MVGVPTTRMPGACWGCPVRGCQCLVGVVGAGTSYASWQDAWCGCLVAGGPCLVARCLVGVFGTGMAGGGSQCQNTVCALSHSARWRDAHCPVGVPGVGRPGARRSTHGGTGGSSCRRPRRSPRRGRTRCGARGVAARSGARRPVPPSAAGRGAPRSRGRAGGPG